MTTKVYYVLVARRALQCLYLCRKNFARLRPSEQFPHHPSLRLSEKVARSVGWGQIATNGRIITPNLVRIVGILTQQGVANYWSSSHQSSVVAPRSFDCAKAPLNITVKSMCTAINPIMSEYIKSVWQSGAKMLSCYGINEAFTARSLFFCREVCFSARKQCTRMPKLNAASVAGEMCDNRLIPPLLIK